MRLQILQRHRGFYPHFFEGDWLVASRRNRLLRSADLGRSWQLLGTLYTDWRALAVKLRLVDRFVQLSISNAVRLGSGDILAIVGPTQWVLPSGSQQFRLVAGSPVDSRPLRRGLMVDQAGAVLIGDYRYNRGEDRGREVRDAVSVHRSTDPLSGVWETAYRFEPGSVRHVHALHQDPCQAGRSWLCTGDMDDESRIYSSDDGYRTLQVFAEAGQISRATDLIFTDDHLYWGVDSPLREPGIVRKAGNGGQIERLAYTLAPVYFGARNEANHFFFSTSVEPGPAVTSSHAEIVASTDGEHFASVASWRSDITPQQAQIHFPCGVAPEDLVVFYCRATLFWENSLVVARLCP